VWPRKRKKKKKKTHRGEVVVDSHDLGAVELSRGDKVDAVHPAVLGRIGLHAAKERIRNVTSLHGQGSDLHNAVLVLADNGTSGMLHIRPVPIFKLHDVSDDCKERGVRLVLPCLLGASEALLSSRNRVPGVVPGVTIPSSLARRISPKRLPSGSYQ
jgi:hypothetical protein